MISRRLARRLVMPAPRDELPEPPAGVELVDIPARKVAVVCFSGRWTDALLWKNRRTASAAGSPSAAKSQRRARICLLQFADDPRPAAPQGHGWQSANLDFSSSNASAASAAPPPLLACLGLARTIAWVHSRRSRSVADQPVHGQRHQPARAFPGDDLEMIGLAADHHAQRDKGVIFAALRCQRDRPGQLQRAGTVIVSCVWPPPRSPRAPASSMSFKCA